ncbi:MAG TPA: FAD-dependent oxidoreductase, partial [Dissulfurispiraceae bacterium]
MDRVNAIIIGAGIVGLAVAARLSEIGGDIVVIERNSHYGLETSSRNSGVIHAGLYYPAGSLKARLCVEGNRMLYALCSAYGIPHAVTGKLIAAAHESERQTLVDLYRRGIENGAGDITLLESDDVRRLDPKVRAAAALYSPRTGIIDVHRLMDHY